MLLIGDCLDRLPELEAGSIDLTVTSPPYDNLRTYNGTLNDWTAEKWQAVIRELYRVTNQGGVVVWVVGDATIKGSETGTSFRQALCHPATFPEALARDRILSWSNPGDLVLDPFLGSGTTAKMAIATGRRFIGIERDPSYMEIAERRVAELQLPLAAE